jgi:diketogulonate reductase-like aldo/keto reductase
VRQSGLKRCDVFITTKVLTAAGSVDKTYEKLLDSVHKIDGEEGYVDLFLIHTASGGSKARKEMWLALERALEDGKTRAIGTSNWGIGHIEELKRFAKVWPPQVNQIEVFIILLLHSHIFSLMYDQIAPCLFSTKRYCGVLSK